MHCLCLLISTLGPLGPSMRVCLTFVFFALLKQSNMAPTSPSAFDSSRHTCRRGTPWSVAVGQVDHESSDGRQHTSSADPWCARSLCRPSGSLSTSPHLVTHHLPKPATPNLQPQQSTSNCHHLHAGQGLVCPLCPRTGSRPLLSSQLVKRRGPLQLTDKAWTLFISSIKVCGAVMHFGLMFHLL